MPTPPVPDWSKAVDAHYAHLSEAEREALRKIWATNYQNFAPLKTKVTGELDPEPVFDILGSGSLGKMEKI